MTRSDRISGKKNVGHAWRFCTTQTAIFLSGESDNCNKRLKQAFLFSLLAPENCDNRDPGEHIPLSGGVL